jgi:hypothetical protein
MFSCLKSRIRLVLKTSLFFLAPKGSTASGGEIWIEEAEQATKAEHDAQAVKFEEGEQEIKIEGLEQAVKSEVDQKTVESDVVERVNLRKGSR